MNAARDVSQFEFHSSLRGAVKFLVPKGVASEALMRGKSTVRDIEMNLNRVLRACCWERTPKYNFPRTDNVPYAPLRAALLTGVFPNFANSIITASQIPKFVAI
jgi:hypothetical protein